MIEIELKPFERIDVERLISWIKSPEFLLQWAGPIFRYPLDEAQLDSYIQGSEGTQPVRKIFKGVNIHDKAVVGHIELNDIDMRNNSATVCRVLVGEPSLRGKGIGIQMLRRLLQIGFDGLGLHRIDLVVFDFNRAAIKCYEGVGFVKEGRLRESRRIGNEYWSLYQMSILEHEWRSSAARG
jgi:RimJ/RimL family protein N-acetyltransferase